MNRELNKFLGQYCITNLADLEALMAGQKVLVTYKEKKLTLKQILSMIVKR
jgi:hypothetical protein